MQSYSVIKNRLSVIELINGEEKININHDMHIAVCEKKLHPIAQDMWCVTRSDSQLKFIKSVAQRDARDALRVCG